VCQLDSGDRDSRVGERLGSLHRRTAALDRTVILLNDIVEVLAGTHLPKGLSCRETLDALRSMLLLLKCHLKHTPLAIRPQCDML